MHELPIPEPPFAGNEEDSLKGSLERQRRTFAWKSLDLNEGQLAMRISTSAMTAGGLIKHLALVEHEYFRVRIAGLPPKEPWSKVDFEVDPMWEWESSLRDSAAELARIWIDSVAESRDILKFTCENGGISALAKWSYRDGRTPSTRRILLDLIEEYSRHNGHLDLLREMIDGRTGEDPPFDFSF